jgi:1-acyl-sn-glycerol-3-phosphate acyltransferase
MPSPEPKPVAEPHISPWLAILLRPIYQLFIPLFFRVRVTGREHIPKAGPVILAVTHRSRWDPVLLPYLTMRLLRFLTSHDEFVGVQGWFMRRLGAFAVNTKRVSPSTLKTCASILLGGDILVIFPEGTIYYYPHDNVHPLRPGTAWLALKVQGELGETPLCVVPIRIRYGTFKPKFRDAAEVEIRPGIDVRAYRDRPEKRAVVDLTADLQAAMGDVVNTSEKEMSTPRDHLPEGRRNRSYGSP